MIQTSAKPLSPKKSKVISTWPSVNCIGSTSFSGWKASHDSIRIQTHFDFKTTYILPSFAKSKKMEKVTTKAGKIRQNYSKIFCAVSQINIQPVGLQSCFWHYKRVFLKEKVLFFKKKKFSLSHRRAQALKPAQVVPHKLIKSFRPPLWFFTAEAM